MVFRNCRSYRSPRVDRQARTDLPLVLRVDADIRIGLRDDGRAERLREAGVVVGARQEIRERRERVGAANRTRKGNRVVVVENINALRARRARRLDATGCRSARTSCSDARVGLPESVPNDATPEMLTAGPIGSVGGALRSPYANWARVSFTVRDDSVMRVADGYAAVDVVEPGRCAGRAQAAGAARVVRRHVVLAVPDAQLIVAADLMIDLAERRSCCRRDSDTCPSTPSRPGIRRPPAWR